MGPLLLLLLAALDTPRAGGAPAPLQGDRPAAGLAPLHVPSRPEAHPLSLALFEPRPALGPPSWKDPLDKQAAFAPRDPARAPLDIGWLFARPDEGWVPEPRPTAPIDPYRFDRPAALVEVRTSTWMDPWREREISESLWELRERTGVNVRIGVGRSECWWR